MFEYAISLVLILFVRKCLKMAIKQGNTEKRYNVMLLLTNIMLVTTIMVSVIDIF